MRMPHAALLFWFDEKRETLTDCELALWNSKLDVFLRILCKQANIILNLG